MAWKEKEKEKRTEEGEGGRCCEGFYFDGVSNGEYICNLVIRIAARPHLKYPRADVVSGLRLLRVGTHARWRMSSSPTLVHPKRYSCLLYGSR